MRFSCRFGNKMTEKNGYLHAVLLLFEVYKDLPSFFEHEFDSKLVRLKFGVPLGFIRFILVLFRLYFKASWTW